MFAELTSDVKDQSKPGTWSSEVHVAALANALEKSITLHSLEHPHGQTYGQKYENNHNPTIHIRLLHHHFEYLLIPTEDNDATDSTGSPKVSDASSDKDEEILSNDASSDEDNGDDEYSSSAVSASYGVQ